MRFLIQHAFWTILLLWACSVACVWADDSPGEAVPDARPQSTQVELADEVILVDGQTDSPDELARAFLREAGETVIPDSPQISLGLHLFENWIGHWTGNSYALYARNSPEFDFHFCNRRFPEHSWRTQLISGVSLGATSNVPSSVPRLGEKRIQLIEKTLLSSGWVTHCGGSIQHQFAVFSLPAGITVYSERFTALEPVEVERIESGRFPFPSGLPSQAHQLAGPEKESLKSMETPASLGSWVNVGDGWGFLTFGQTRWCFEPDPLHPKLLLQSPPKRLFEADEPILQRTFIVVWDQRQEETQVLARTLEREGDLQTSRLLFQLKNWLLTIDYDTRLPELRIEPARSYGDVMTGP